MKCPECGGDMVLRETGKYRYGNGKPRKFYGCENFPKCKSAHGAHPDGRPLGIPADKETKAWRIKAHDAMRKAFGDMSRDKQYKKIQTIMGLAEEDAHIGRFSLDQCRELIALLRKDSDHA